MNARILFLGTGGDEMVVGKQMRSSGGVMLQIDKNQFHLDPGPGSLVMSKMMGINPRQTTALFITKNSIEAANDINAVIYAMTHNGLDKRGVIVAPHVVTDGEHAFLKPSFKDYVEKIINVDNSSKIGINSVDVEVVEHADNTVGYKFSTDRFILGYVPAGAYQKSIASAYDYSDILIINTKYPQGVNSDDGMNMFDVHHLIDRVKPQLAIITGFGVKMLQADPLYEARMIQKDAGIQIIAAKDGMTINPLSFSTAVRQKNLSKY